jgi:NCS2 family nucleobase:cation symporter-2/xanthine permease XanP
MQTEKLKYGVDETPPWHLAAALAFIHVLVIFDGIIFIPNVLGKTLPIAPDRLQFVTFGIILIAAVFTYLQSRRNFGIGAGFILFTGSYSAFLACSIDAVRMGGFETLAAMALLSVPVVFLYTFFIRFFRHIITPAVGGVVILLIATSMVPIALEIWSGSGPASTRMSVAKLGVGSLTALTLTVFMLFGGRLKLWGPLLSLGTGYAAAALTGQLHFEHTLQASWFGLPPWSWPGIELHLTATHLPLLFAFTMAMLASVIENTGDIMLVQQISQRDFRRVSYDQVQAGLYCDGLSKVAGGLFGTAVPSVYCDNLPLIEITGVASRRVGVCGAGLLLVLAFMPKVSGFILDMPRPVMGGFLIVIVALLFHAGIGLVTVNRFDNQHGIILGLSLTIGLVAESGTYFPGVVPDTLAPVLQNSVAIGGFTAFMLSTIAYLIPKKTLGGTFRAVIEDLPRVQAMLDNGRKKLEIPDQTFDRLSLCCEEVFCYMTGEKTGDEERSLTFRVSRTEGGYFTEVVCGYQMDDINNFAVPESFFQAKPEELKKLGMILFAKYARDVKHLDISGYSFISFVI